MTLTTGWSAPAAGEAPMAMARAASHLRLLRLQPQTPRRSARADRQCRASAAVHPDPSATRTPPSCSTMACRSTSCSAIWGTKDPKWPPIRGHRRSGIPQTVHPRGVQSDTCRPPIESGL